MVGEFPYEGIGIVLGALGYCINATANYRKAASPKVSAEEVIKSDSMKLLLMQRERSFRKEILLEVGKLLAER